MTNYEKIYWITRLDSVSNVFTTMFFVSLVFLALYLLLRVVWSGEDPDDDEIAEHNRRWGVWKKTAIVLMFVGGIAQAFIPTRNEAILIMAGGKTLDFAQGDSSLSKLPAQTTAIISEYMDNALKDMREGKK